MIASQNLITLHTQAAKKVGKKIGERAILLSKLSEKKGAGETDLDEHFKGQVNNRTQERRHLVP